jgi:hypothetical protein
VVNAATENAESSTINSIVVSSKHPNAELFVKTAFIVWEVEKLAGNGLVIKTPFESLLKEQFWSKYTFTFAWSFVARARKC